MAVDETPDYYEILQVNTSADPETVHRVFRLMAQRFHPDNRESGNETRFRQVQEAYDVLKDPVRRAQYDVTYTRLRQERWRLVSSGSESETNFRTEGQTRVTILEVLYTHRRLDPQAAGVFYMDLEGMTGRPRERLEFTIWYLIQKGLVARGDNARLSITADGVDYLEQNYEANLQRKRIEQGAGPGG